MLDIDFIKADVPLQFKLGGLEFMDSARERNVYETLSRAFDEILVQKDLGKHGTWDMLEWGKSEKEAISKIIMAETGILINFVDTGELGLAINSGFLAPGAVLNNKDVEKVVDGKYNSISQAMKVLNADVLRGWVDVKAGRIGGDFSKVQFDIYINNLPGLFFNTDFLTKHNLSMGQAMAMAVIHELGHPFSGFYFLVRQTTDAILVSLTSRMMMEAPASNRRVAVYKEFAKELGIPDRIDEQAIGGMDDEGNITAFLNKMVANRNIRSTLSLGVADRSSEVYADMFAMKMGCPKALVTMLRSITGSGVPVWLHMFIWIPTLAFLPWLGIAAIPLALTGFLQGSLFLYLDLVYHVAPNDTYDNPYRRVKAVLREYAAEVAATPGNNADKALMLKKAKEIEALVEEQKHFMEGTVMQRFAGWMVSGTDFKAAEFDHYTQELLNHNLSLYTDYFKKD
jgi:hypothetical protein